MGIKYRAEFFYEPKITKIEIEKETESSVWIGGRRLAKNSEGHAYCNSFEEAKACLVSEFDRRAKAVRRELEVINGRLGNAKGMKEKDVRGIR